MQKTFLINPPELPNIACKKYEKKRTTLENSETIEVNSGNDTGCDDDETIQFKRGNRN